MSEPAARRWIPWGSVLTIGVLAIVLALVLRGDLEGIGVVPWAAVAAVILTAGAAFQGGRWLLSWAWGLFLGLAIALHPVMLEVARTAPPPILAEGLQLVALALVLAAWRLAFRPEAAWLGWLAVGVGLCLVLSLAWLVEPRVGLSASLLTLASLTAVPFLAASGRRAPVLSIVPSRWNGLAAFLVGVGAPVAGLLLVAPLAEALIAREVTLLGVVVKPPAAEGLDLLRTAVAVDGSNWRLPGFSTGELETWCWPSPWLVLPAAAWGLWRSLRRGWKLRPAGRAPLSWVLLVYTGTVLVGMTLHPDGVVSARDLPLASLTLILAVFCVGDLMRGAIAAMRLPPPQESEEPAAA